MRIEELNNKRVCLIGFGIENRATLRAIEKYAPRAEVTVADAKDILNTPVRADQKPVQLQIGPTYLQNLERFDILIKTPGVPPCDELERLRDKLTNSSQIFLDTVSAHGSTVIGVTGTKGKSTTSSLIAAMLKRSGLDTFLVGNIGIPTLDYIENAKENTIFVQEMSSYQLMDSRVSPPFAVVTSLFPDHLDYHGSYEAYKDAKKNIARFQRESDTIFFAETPAATKEIADASPGEKVPFSEKDALIPVEDTHLIGMHNQRNMGGAWRVAERFGVDPSIAIDAIQDFRGLPHRLQNLGIHHGLEWVDDAISTTPESTIEGIKALGSELETIIVGGQDRGYDFTELGRLIAGSSILTVITLPESGDKIREAIERFERGSIRFCEAFTMEEAVAYAKEFTEIGNICLLSPASPSYNQFRNFEEKGECFRNSIQ